MTYAVGIITCLCLKSLFIFKFKRGLNEKEAIRSHISMKLLNWCFNNCLCLRLIYKSYVKNVVADETKCAHQSNESHLVVFVTIHVIKVLSLNPILAPF